MFKLVAHVQFFSSGNPLQYRSFFERWQFSPWQNFCPSTIFWAVWLIGDFLCQPCHNGGLNKKEKITAPGIKRAKFSWKKKSFPVGFFKKKILCMYYLRIFPTLLLTDQNRKILFEITLRFLFETLRKCRDGFV